MINEIKTAATKGKSVVLAVIAAAKSEQAQAYYQAAWETTQRVVLIAAYTAYKAGGITRKALNFAIDEWNKGGDDHDLGNRVNRVSQSVSATLEVAQTTATKKVEDAAEKVLDTESGKAIKGATEKVMEFSKGATEKAKTKATQAIQKADAEAIETAFDVAGDVTAIARRAVLKGIGFVISGVMPGAMPKAYTR